MNLKKIIGSIVIAALTGAGIWDAVRYLQPHANEKIIVQPRSPINLQAPTELVLVYNAYGGIYPSVVDFVHKEFFPASYACNLCYQTFGTFTMKKEWQAFLASLAVKKSFYHKDDFNRKYRYTEALPALFISDGQSTQVLLPAADINKATSLPQLITMVKAAWQPFRQ